MNQESSGPPPIPAEKSWLVRNWVWLLAVGAILLCLGCGGCLSGLFFGIKGMMSQTDAYQEGLERARTHPEVVAELGEPIQTGWFISGNVSVSDSEGELDIRVPIYGPDGKGTLFIEAEKTGGIWEFLTLNVKFKPSGRRVDLLKKTDDAPVEVR